MPPPPPHDADITGYLPIFKSLFDRHTECVLIAAMDDTIIYYNAAQSRLDDILQEKALGRRICDVYNISEECSPTIQVLRTGKAIFDEVHFYRTHRGKLVNSSCRIYPIVLHGVLCGALSFIQEYSIMQLEALEALQKKTKVPRMARSEGGMGRQDLAESRRRKRAYKFSTMIGKDRKLLEAATSAKQAAKTPSPVLLSGETGVGKEVFARSIHEYSPRAKQTFTAINCSAVPETLLEGILFGTTKGAFTGAVDKAGIFENADGGTLFLDEVDSMPLGLQSKLLRVLQERRIRRVGELHERAIDVKLISSIGRPPQEAMARGLLRKDFYFRIGVVQLRIPPLRERMGDLPLLAKHFVQKHCKLLRIKEPLISPEVMDAFYRYPWPGNIRELEHCLEACLNVLDTAGSINIEHMRRVYPNLFEPAFHEDDQLAFAGEERHIPITIRGSSIGPLDGPQSPPEPAAFSAPPAFPPPGTGRQAPYGPPLHQMPEALTLTEEPETLAQKKARLERDTICTALLRTGGTKHNAARLLGISQQLLQHKLKKYDIDARAFIPTRL